MKPLLWLFLIVFLAGCEKSRPPSPSSGAGPNHASAAECAAILQDVRAGRDIIINIRCDQPTESKLIAALAATAWTASEHYAIPSTGWRATSDEMNSEFLIMPTPGSYWSQYDLRIEVSPFGLSQVDYAYVNAENAQEIANLFPSFDSELVARVASVRAMYPVSYGEISEQAHELLMSPLDEPLTELHAAIQKRIIDHLQVRHDVHYEDGRSTEILRLAVQNDGKRFSTGVTLLPFIDAYPAWPSSEQEDHPSATRIACSASKTIRLTSFKSVCAIFLEHQALASGDRTNEKADAVVDMQ